MIVCPNCKHNNPEGATNCEACYTALPATKACPNCGASIQLDATFCGQCGHSLKPAESKSPILPPPPATPAIGQSPRFANDLPPEMASVGLPPTVLTSPSADILSPPPHRVEAQTAGEMPPTVANPDLLPLASETIVPAGSLPVEPAAEIVAAPVSTQLQPSARQLLHVQTNTIIELPPLQVVHIGKPNETIAPDLDVSSFPCAEVVSRIHANIRLEGENYYIEDVGSANGTYINHNVLAKGNRHLLQTGDRIGLGKGDLVTLIFQSPV